MVLIVELVDEGRVGGSSQPDASRTPITFEYAHGASFSSTSCSPTSRTMFGGRSGVETTSSGSGPHITTKGWTLQSLLNDGKNFRSIERISALSDPKVVERKVREHEESNIPLIVEDCHKHSSWNQGLFTLECLENANSDEGGISVRNCINRRDKKMKFSEFVAKCRATPKLAVAGESERYYGKDLNCPLEWKQLFEPHTVLPKNTTLYGCEDLLRLLRKEPGDKESDGSAETEEVETLMCYLGVGDTFTPAHKDPCASSGQNLMVITEDDACSYWFMTDGASAPQAADLFHKLGHELDLETHIAPPGQLSSFSPFPIYVGKQVLGDLVLVPKRCCHQVINSGGITVKMSWSRMTVDGLVTAFHHELPIYRRVCRRETYRVKLLVLRTIQRLTQELRGNAASEARKELEERRASLKSSRPSPSSLASSSQPPVPTTPEDVQDTVDKMVIVLSLFDKIVKEEFVDLEGVGDLVRWRNGHEQAEGSRSFYGLTCDFCGADIFQSFFECSSCGDSSPSGSQAKETYPVHICVGCYVEGRTCKCEKAQPKQRCRSDIFFKIQNAAVEAVKPFVTGKVKPINLGIKTLRHVTHPSLFQAACTLWLNRLENPKKPSQGSGLRRCRYPHNVHDVPLAHAIHCKKCHSSRCLTHILEKLRIHCSTAILEVAKDKTHENWHKFHANTKKDLKEQTRKAEEEIDIAEKEGAPCEMSVRLVSVAEKYNKSYASLDASKTSKGMYDDRAFQNCVGDGTIGMAVDEENEEETYQEALITTTKPSTRKDSGPASALRRNVSITTVRDIVPVGTSSKTLVSAPTVTPTSNPDASATVPGPRTPRQICYVEPPELDPIERLKYKSKMPQFPGPARVRAAVRPRRISQATESPEKSAVGATSKRVERRKETSIVVTSSNATTTTSTAPPVVTPIPRVTAQKRPRVRSASSEALSGRARAAAPPHRKERNTVRKENPPDEPPYKRTCVDGLKFHKKNPRTSIEADVPETDSRMSISPPPTPASALPLQITPTIARGSPPMASPAASSSSTLNPQESMPQVGLLGLGKVPGASESSPIIISRGEFNILQDRYTKLEGEVAGLRGELKETKCELKETKKELKESKEQFTLLANRPPSTSILVQTGASSSATVGADPASHNGSGNKPQAPNNFQRNGPPDIPSGPKGRNNNGFPMANPEPHRFPNVNHRNFQQNASWSPRQNFGMNMGGGGNSVAHTALKRTYPRQDNDGSHGNNYPRGGQERYHNPQNYQRDFNTRHSDNNFGDRREIRRGRSPSPYLRRNDPGVETTGNNFDAGYSPPNKRIKLHRTRYTNSEETPREFVDASRQDPTLNPWSAEGERTTSPLHSSRGISNDNGNGNGSLVQNGTNDGATTLPPPPLISTISPTRDEPPAAVANMEPTVALDMGRSVQPHVFAQETLAFDTDVSENPWMGLRTGRGFN